MEDRRGDETEPSDGGKDSERGAAVAPRRFGTIGPAAVGAVSAVVAGVALLLITRAITAPEPAPDLHYEVSFVREFLPGDRQDDDGPTTLVALPIGDLLPAEDPALPTQVVDSIEDRLNNDVRYLVQVAISNVGDRRSTDTDLRFTVAGDITRVTPTAGSACAETSSASGLVTVGCGDIAPGVTEIVQLGVSIPVVYRDGPSSTASQMLSDQAVSAVTDLVGIAQNLECDQGELVIAEPHNTYLAAAAGSESFERFRAPPLEVPSVTAPPEEVDTLPSWVTDHVVDSSDGAATIDRILDEGVRALDFELVPNRPTDGNPDTLGAPSSDNPGDGSSAPGSGGVDVADPPPRHDVTMESARGSGELTIALSLTMGTGTDRCA
jgi:hypothetical protein